MNQDDFMIPRNLDAPPLMFMWEADSAAIYILFVFLGALMQMFLFGIFCAVVVGRAYARLKEEGGKGLLMKIVYWYTPSTWLTQRHPSHIREFYGE
jgi:conjugal transfer pilus assembly protein TraL